MEPFLNLFNPAPLPDVRPGGNKDSGEDTSLTFTFQLAVGLSHDRKKKKKQKIITKVTMNKHTCS